MFCVSSILIFQVLKAALGFHLKKWKKVQGIKVAQSLVEPWEATVIFNQWVRILAYKAVT